MFDGEATRERIREVFCPDCKLNKECKQYELKDGICKNFVWRTRKLQEQREQEVRRNQAVTAWLSKGKNLEEIYSFTEKQLLSILPKPAQASNSELTKQTSPFPKLETSAKQSQTDYLYFYCTRDNKQKKFKRNLNNPSEIKSFRKYLLSNGYKIEKETINDED